MGPAACLKCLLYLQNILFLCLGCLFMYLGVFVASDETIHHYGWLLPIKFPMPLVYYLMIGDRTLDYFRYSMGPAACLKCLLYLQNLLFLCLGCLFMYLGVFIASDETIHHYGWLLPIKFPMPLVYDLMIGDRTRDYFRYSMGPAACLKCLLYLQNILFLCLGCLFMYLGVFIASDETIHHYGWLLPIKFPMPLVYYLMIGDRTRDYFRYSMGPAACLKCLLYLQNLLFLCLGCLFMYLGVFIASDETILHYGWLLPIMFPMPLVYYLMIGVTLLGVLYSALAVLGLCSVYVTSRVLFSFYIFCLSLLLITETAGLISASLAPDHFGLRVDREDLTEDWQRLYAIPGKDQYTAAIDFIQTQGECCGSVEGKEWTTSWWRLRDYGPEGTVVPLSCCRSVDMTSYLDPSPGNVSACQNEDKEVHSSARHTQGCSEVLESWLKGNLRKMVYLSTGSIFYQLCLLLASICGAVHIFTHTAKSTVQ